MKNMLFHYVLSYILVGITLSIIAAFVYLQNRKNTLYRTFAVYNLAIAWWCFFSIPAILQRDPSIAVNWCRTFIVGAIFIPTFFLHFTLLFLGILDKYRKLLKLCYTFSVVFLLLNFTPLFIQAAEPKITLRAYTVPGPVFNIHVLYFFTIMFFGEALLLKKYLHEKNSIEGKRILYYLSTGLLATIGGGANYLPVYRIEVPVLNPFGTYCLVLYGVTVGYIILRYGFLEIQVIIKKSLIFAGLFFTAYAIFAVFTLLGQSILENIIQWNRWFAIIPSIFVIILGFRPLENFLINLTDKYLFQKKYDYAQLVNKFMDDLRTMALNTNDIAHSTIKFLSTSIRPTKSAILLYNKFKNRYDPISSFGIKEAGFTFLNDAPIVKELNKSAKIMKIEEEQDESEKGKRYLSEIDIKLVLPLSINKELIGILFLGKKMSDEEYTVEDIEVLSGLSITLSIALNNAQLFGERADAEKRALVGTLATGINHEIGNPLNIMRIKFDSYRILNKEGFYTNKTKKELMEIVDNIADACTESIERIGGIAKQIAEFAKPDKSLLFDKVNVKESAEKIVAVLKHGMIENVEKIEMRTTPAQLYVIVDRGQFEQVLFNLLKNACHAIDKEKGKILFEASQVDDDTVQVKVEDNGHGIPENVKSKVFMPFFTTKDPGKGTGLGLTLTKIMVEKNGGSIVVESEEGKGTTFVVLLKGNG